MLHYNYCPDKNIKLTYERLCHTAIPQRTREDYTLRREQKGDGNTQCFYYLLNEYAHSKDLMLIAEISTKNKQGKIITPDGTLKDNIRNDWGYWESKDESDDINEEIRKKFDKGYPSDNILFEDSHTAVLYQHGEEVMRRNMQDEDQLHQILTLFLSYERPEVHDFREAIEHFKQDIPKVTVAIRDIIDLQYGSSRNEGNVAFIAASAKFLEMAKASINPDITGDDVKEMMIQHILSADIFNTIFDEPHFHQENNIARELNKIIDTFFNGQVRRQTLGQIKHYYDTINARAASIADHHEKQKFLKVVYENFYKGYNPKAADRLGIVYTPNEIVQFMIRSTDYLLHKHFGKTLGDKNVEILDPATGTGTFITDIIDYLPKAKLKHKYKSELHANEVAILPYYIANLNIEYTYKQKMGEYEEFENLCFVDTLDKSSQHLIQTGLFNVSAENATRIKRQNERKISVVIGNPPYNANQQNENDNNKNRQYEEVDRRIKDTFIKHSTAQKTKLYDMYSRFYRWAMDRLNDNGIISFITNRSFIDSRTFDGFRKIASSEFNNIYIIDLGGDIRSNPKLSGPKHDVFGIQTGIAIMILVRQNNKLVADNKRELKALKREFSSLEEPIIEYKSKTFYANDNARIQYVRRPEMETALDKLNWISQSKIEELDFDTIRPDKNNNWINNSDNDWEGLLPVCDKLVKGGVSDRAIFEKYSTGISTNRDEWIIDFSKDTLASRMTYFIKRYDVLTSYDASIKWSRNLKQRFGVGKKESFDFDKIKKYNHRPYTPTFIYHSDLYIDEQGLTKIIFPKKNFVISLCSTTSNKEFHALAIDSLYDLHFTGDSQGVPLYLYDAEGVSRDNITNWALEQFGNHYKQIEPSSPVCYAGSSELREEYNIGDSNSSAITKEAIFHYVYAVLHNPAYRKKYELNLKREFPRIPFYDDFWQWSKWGEQLMNLHIHYETSRTL
jgi:predicted helicase